jgi:rhamnosyltransferase
MTQDALPVDERLIENLTAPLADRGIAYCYGRQIARHDATPPERFTRSFNYPDVPATKGKAEIATLGIKAFFSSNVCSAVRREAFEAAGGFPPTIISNEDMILASKLIMRGYRVVYQPQAAVYHSHRYSLLQQFQRYFDIGVSLNRNRYILETVGPDREGRRFLKNQVSSLARDGAWVWIPYVCAEALAKYAGFRLGLSEDRIPRRLRRRFSMHKQFWLKYNNF